MWKPQLQVKSVTNAGVHLFTQMCRSGWWPRASNFDGPRNILHRGRPGRVRGAAHAAWNTRFVIMLNRFLCLNVKKPRIKTQNHGFVRVWTSWLAFFCILVQPSVHLKDAPDDLIHHCGAVKFAFPPCMTSDRTNTRFLKHMFNQECINSLWIHLQSAWPVCEQTCFRLSDYKFLYWDWPRMTHAPRMSHTGCVDRRGVKQTWCSVKRWSKHWSLKIGTPKQELDV